MEGGRAVGLAACAQGGELLVRVALPGVGTRTLRGGKAVQDQTATASSSHGPEHHIYRMQGPAPGCTQCSPPLPIPLFALPTLTVERGKGNLAKSPP